MVGLFSSGMVLKSFLEVGEQAQVAPQSTKLFWIQARIHERVWIKFDYTFCLWLTHGTIHSNRQSIVVIIGVRLRVEQNQLVVVCWRFGSRVIELQGA
jgi:uncharacterized membrane protein YccF (DUF307 family)